MGKTPSYLTLRHLNRLKQASLAKGATALTSKKRGKTNHRHSAKLKNHIRSLIIFLLD
jgi:hypothetical protein